MKPSAKEYAVAVGKNWWKFLLAFAGIGASLFFYVELQDRLKLQWWAWALFGSVSLHVAQFAAWRDLYKSSERHIQRLMDHIKLADELYREK